MAASAASAFDAISQYARAHDAYFTKMNPKHWVLVYGKPWMDARKQERADPQMHFVDPKTHARSFPLVALPAGGVRAARMDWRGTFSLPQDRSEYQLYDTDELGKAKGQVTVDYMLEDVDVAGVTTAEAQALAVAPDALRLAAFQRGLAFRALMCMLHGTYKLADDKRLPKRVKADRDLVWIHHKDTCEFIRKPAGPKDKPASYAGNTDYETRMLKLFKATVGPPLNTERDLDYSRFQVRMHQRMWLELAGKDANKKKDAARIRYSTKIKEAAAIIADAKQTAEARKAAKVELLDAKFLLNILQRKGCVPHFLKPSVLQPNGDPMPLSLQKAEPGDWVVPFGRPIVTCNGQKDREPFQIGFRLGMLQRMGFSEALRRRFGRVSQAEADRALVMSNPAPLPQGVPQVMEDDPAEQEARENMIGDDMLDALFGPSPARASGVKRPRETNKKTTENSNDEVDAVVAASEDDEKTAVASQPAEEEQDDAHDNKEEEEEEDEEEEEEEEEEAPPRSRRKTRK